MQLTATEAKRRLGEITAGKLGEVVHVTRYGEPCVAFLSIERLKELEAIERHVKSLPSLNHKP